MNTKSYVPASPAAISASDEIKGKIKIQNMTLIRNQSINQSSLICTALNHTHFMIDDKNTYPMS